MIVSPEAASRLAGESVEFVRKRFGFALPYTPESLIVVDAIVDKIKETGATEHQASGLLSGLGCYVGEVFVRNAKGTWRSTAEMGMKGSCRFPMVVALPGLAGVTACDPLGKVFQRFGLGAAESVALLFEKATSPLADAPEAARAESATAAPKQDLS